MYLGIPTVDLSEWSVYWYYIFYRYGRRCSHRRILRERGCRVQTLRRTLYSVQCTVYYTLYQYNAVYTESVSLRVAEVSETAGFLLVTRGGARAKRGGYRRLCCAAVREGTGRLREQWGEVKDP